MTRGVTNVPCRTAHKLSMWTTVRRRRLQTLGRLGPCRKERKVGSWMLHWFFIEPLLSYKHVAIDASTNKYPPYSMLYIHLHYIYIYCIDIHIYCNCLERQPRLALKPSERLHMDKDLPQLQMWCGIVLSGIGDTGKREGGLECYK